MTQLSNGEGEREEVISSMWTNGFVSKFQNVFGIAHNERDNTRAVPKSTPPLSLSEDIDDMEPQRRVRGLFDREPRGLSSTQPHYLSMRSADYTSDSTEGSFLESADKKINHDEFFRTNSLFGGDKNARPSSVNIALTTRQPPAANDNFGLEEEVKQPHGRRYANM